MAHPVITLLRGSYVSLILTRRVPSSYKGEAPAYCWCLCSDLLASPAGPASRLGSLV